MSTAIVQEDFGGFSPRFPAGVGISLGSPAAYAVFSDYLAAAGESASDSLGAIAVKSVLEHEVRHFHDALLSPWGGLMVRMRVQALVNGAQAIRVAREVAGDTLPLPVTAWLALDPDERREYVTDWEEELGETLTPIELPRALDTAALARVAGAAVDVSALDAGTQLVTYAAGAVGAYETIRTLVAGDPPPGAPSELRPPMVFEATALAIQIETIRRSQGLPEALQFVDFLLSSERPYARLWRKFTQLGLLLGRHRHPGEDDAALLFGVQADVVRMGLWTVLGDQQQDGMSACPTRRFATLAAHLVERHAEPVNHGDETAAAWDAWDAATGTRPWRDGCLAALAATQRAIGLYARLEELWQGDPEIPRLISRVMTRRAIDQETMVRRLVEAPDALTDVTAYLDHQPGDLPLPALRVELDGFAVSPPRGGPGFRAVRTVEVDGATLISSYALVLGGATAGAALDDLLLFENLVCACDLTFSDHALPWAVFERSREAVQSIARKRVVLVI